jgi:phosphoribosylaminoimidazole-succinocarboxamide synthase
MNLVKRKEGVIVLIDEIHTPDSSRYFIQKDIRKGRIKGEEQKQLSKRICTPLVNPEWFSRFRGAANS